MGLIDDLRDTSATALQRWISKSDEDVSFDDMSEALAKGGLVTAQPTEEKPRAMFHDPYSVMDWGGWRQRPSAVTYETLRQMSVANTVIRAIINLRVNQVSQFARPQQGKYDKGYRIIYRDRRDSKRAMTPVEMRKALEIERLLETTGFLLPNEKPSDRDSFRAYLKKSVQDILTYDQWCTELQRDVNGKVSRFVCLPGETIRPAVADVEHMNPEEYRSRVSHVQVYENTVIAEFGVDDIAWSVMNPRSDLRVNGFGFSYVEQVIRLVTSWLFGFDYNMRFFTQGSAVKGLLNIQGTVPDRQMRAFRRMWYSMVSGVQNAWKTPILNSENVQWINMHSTNRDMEYGAWMDFQTKMLCAVFGCDPIEINFIYGNTGQSGGLNQSRPNESEVSESKDKGLRPIVEHIQDTINRHIVWDLAPDFEFSFTGLDAKSEQAEREAMLADVRGKKMVDEIRAEDNLPPLPDGKGQVILDPTWMQFAAQADQATQGGAPGGPPGGGFGGDGGGDDQPDFGAEDGGDEEQLMSAPDKGDSMGNGLADKQDQDSMLAASFREVNEILRKARVDGERQIIDIVVR